MSPVCQRVLILTLAGLSRTFIYFFVFVSLFSHIYGFVNSVRFDAFANGSGIHSSMRMYPTSRLHFSCVLRTSQMDFCGGVFEGHLNGDKLNGGENMD